MQIRTYETKNNIYYIGKMSKTTYEEQEERKERFKYMFMQKGIGLILTSISIIMLVYGVIPAVLPLITGVATTLTNDRVIG
jgi:hypothetical protein